MKTKKTNRFCACILLLALLLALPMPASAEEHQPMPIVSQNLMSYASYILPQGSGNLQIRFTVTAKDDMDEIGAVGIMLYESTDNQNFTCKRSYISSVYTNMVSSNKSYYSTYVSYPGVAGRYYKCYVTFCGVKDGQEDRRYQWTSVVQAT